MKKIKHNGYIIVNLDIYVKDLMFFVGDPEVLLDKLDRYFVFADGVIEDIKEDFKITSKGKTIITEENQTLIWIPKLPETPMDFCYLQHEIFHATTMILKASGLKLTDKSDEAYAYLNGYITRKIYESLPNF